MCVFMCMCVCVCVYVCVCVCVHVHVCVCVCVHEQTSCIRAVTRMSSEYLLNPDSLKPLSLPLYTNTVTRVKNSVPVCDTVSVWGVCVRVCACVWGAGGGGGRLGSAVTMVHHSRLASPSTQAMKSKTAVV